MKKALCITLVFAILMTLFVVAPFTANAEEKNIAETGAKSGATGSCTWTLNGTVLTISGNGAMADYEWDDTLPWGTSITKLIIANGVTHIGKNAFSTCRDLMSVTIPDSVTSIGDFAFSNCDGLTSVTIPDSVTSISYWAFCFCGGLTSVTLNPYAVNHYRDIFYGCNNVASVTIRDSVTSIGSETFSYCTALTSVTIPNSVTSIGNYAFNYCTGLTSVTIPNSVTSIGYNAFSDCTGLTSITIPDSVTSIGDYAFSGCSGLTSVTIPDSITSLSERLFSGCSRLESVTIPDSVTSIGYEAFRDCTGLTNVTIPDSVETIGTYAFFGTSLKRVIIPASVTEIYSCAFGYYYNDDFEETKVKNFTIYGYTNTEAQRYANDNGFTFIPLDSARFTVSGTQTSYLDKSGMVTIQLLQNGSVKYSTTTTGNTGSYSIPNVAYGSYILRVSKKNHVTRDYPFTVSADPIQNVKIHPKGDISGDGRITSKDFAMAYANAQKLDTLTGYALKCGDVVKNDGQVKTADAARIYAHAQKLDLLW